MISANWRSVIVALLLLCSAPWSPAFHGQDKKRPTLLLVTNKDDNSVSIFDASGAPTLAGTVPVGAAPGGLCVAPDGNHAYVLNKAGNSISVVDLDSLKTVATVTQPKLEKPEGCVVGSDSKRIYVVAGELLLVVSAASHGVVQELPLGRGLTKVVISPDGRNVYASSDVTGHVYVVDTGTVAVVATIKAGFSSRYMAFSPDGKALLVVHTFQDTLSVIDVATHEVLTTIGVGTAPQTVAVSSDGELALVVARGNHHLNVIFVGGENTRKSFRSVDLPPRPIDMVMTDRYIYVIHDAGELSVVRARTLETFEFQAAKTGKAPQAIAIRPS